VAVNLQLQGVNRLETLAKHLVTELNVAHLQPT
jgi:hypothetical protein